MGFCSANQALSNCSIDHAASPNSFRPTMRELPLSVWNARRKVVCSLRSPGSERSVWIAARPLVTTSRASSRKIPSSSSSSSSTRVDAGAATGTDTGMVANASKAGASEGAATSVATSAAGSCAETDVSSASGAEGSNSSMSAAAGDAAKSATTSGLLGSAGGTYRLARGTTSGNGTAARSSILCANSSGLSS